MAKPTSLSDPSILIGSALYVVRLSGWCFGQTLVWPAHFGPPTPRVSGFGKVDADAASIANVGILPQKTSRWIDRGTMVRCGQRNEGSKQDDFTSENKRRE